MTTPSRQLAKDVASELERRKRTRKLLFISVWAAAIIAAVMYMRCGSGWGTGGKGAGEDERKWRKRALVRSRSTPGEE